jgi:hypothetical protein
MKPLIPELLEDLMPLLMQSVPAVNQPPAHRGQLELLQIVSLHGFSQVFRPTVFPGVVHSFHRKAFVLQIGLRGVTLEDRAVVIDVL